MPYERWPPRRFRGIRNRKEDMDRVACTKMQMSVVGVGPNPMSAGPTRDNRNAAWRAQKMPSVLWVEKRSSLVTSFLETLRSIGRNASDLRGPSISLAA
eukprot:3842888-Prymnesium_polylepis.4